MFVAVVPSRSGASRFASIGATVIAAAILAFAFLSRSSGAAGATSSTYPIDYQVASPHLSAAFVEAVVLGKLNGMSGTANGAKVLRMSVVPMSLVSTVEPLAGAPGPGAPDADNAVWVVRAQGSFLVNRVPPGGHPFVGATGFFLVDDATGETVGMGTP
jgi:hypothetical protein